MRSQGWGTGGIADSGTGFASGNSNFHGGPRPLRRRIKSTVEFGLAAAADHRSARIPRLQSYFVIVCRVGATVDVGAAFEIAKVSQTFQPSGRFSAANSR